ncbi:hypothetical protein CV102_10970 [Natronococcus pandeyae]|uniref:Glutamate--cysteine ligase n=1 Tax=Natronococcus pandeyae TaxID=2055836 RepID=A0A8J8Q1D4_9EURY|nr:hypothetical protein [Natronococcus pandeyae]TYL38330.1 hypothetical protein CV102_10970 [Natronococcus pandeyae]
MIDTDLVDSVRASIATDSDRFAECVEREAERLKDDVREGTFDNPQAIVGLEYEFYGVDRETAALRRIPRWLLRFIGFEKELGLHNAELNTSPQPLNSYGLAAQQREVQSRLAAARERTRTEGVELVSDGIWTIPPTGESANRYLTDTVDRGGITISTNASPDVRYQAMSNASYPAGMRLEAPHVDFSADTVALESLITSIQPHYQVPYAADLPEFFRYAVRIAGPLLAIGVNSPFFPPELYEDPDPDAVLADGWMEHRIGIFETVMNPTDETPDKVRFPRDIQTVEDAVDRIAADVPIVPNEIPDRGRFDDRYRHLSYKHGSYWRWLRPVFDAPSETTANARIEFRPLPAQPTVRDSIAFLAAFAGLMESLPRREHPIGTLEWERARENFYAAVRDGLDAELVWIDSNGDRTTDRERCYDELLSAARDGLETRGLAAETIDRYLEPLSVRVDREVTPAAWKRRRVRERLEAGASLTEAIPEVQRTYIDEQRETLLEGSFVDWLE